MYVSGYVMHGMPLQINPGANVHSALTCAETNRSCAFNVLNMQAFGVGTSSGMGRYWFSMFWFGMYAMFTSE